MLDHHGRTTKSKSRTRAVLAALAYRPPRNLTHDRVDGVLTCTARRRCGNSRFKRFTLAACFTKYYYSCSRGGLPPLTTTRHRTAFISALARDVLHQVAQYLVARCVCMHVREAGLLLGLPTYLILTDLPTHLPTHRRRPTARLSRWAIQRAARRRGHPSHGSCSRRATPRASPRYLVITPGTARARGEL